MGFWLLWFVFIQLAYHFPNAIFPGWDIKAKNAISIKRFGVDYITIRGGWSKMLWEIFYRQFFILTSYIAFTYAVVYFILPRFISNKKKWVTTAGLFILCFIAFLLMDYAITYFTHLDSHNRTTGRVIMNKIPSTNSIISTTLVPAAFNLTTLVGLAVMIKLLKRWSVKQKETLQVAKEKTSAELQLLKAQVHPHFLFNSLNNIYSFALDASPQAPEMIRKLSDLLHYMLHDCKQATVPLEKEIKMIHDYITLERIRYGERLKLEINIQDISEGHQSENKSIRIAPLLLIPFIENCFKHGTSQVVGNPRVGLSITVQDNTLFFKLTNSKPSNSSQKTFRPNSGLGLKNVEKRLALIYPGQYELKIISDPAEYFVWLRISLTKSEKLNTNEKEKKGDPVYEMA